MDSGSLLKAIMGPKEVKFCCHLVGGCLKDNHATSPSFILDTTWVAPVSNYCAVKDKKGGWQFTTVNKTADSWLPVLQQLSNKEPVAAKKPHPEISNENKRSTT